MAQSATKERPNTVRITDAGPSLKKIEIEIPAETVAEQLGTSIDTLMADAELPGFRRGHVPKRLLEKKFGSTVRREARNQLVSSAYTKAIEDNKLRVIGDAATQGMELLEIEDGKPLKFEVEVEVLPEFTLPALEDIAVRKPTIEVSDEAVEKDIEQLRLNEGSLKEKAHPGPGDYLTGHSVMTDASGKTILDIPDAVIQVPPADRNGRGMILGVMVEDFEKQLGKPGIGQTVTIKTNGPDNHENEAIRGVPLTVTFKVKTAQEIVPADLAEIAQRSGLSGPDDVRSAIRQRNEQRVQVEQQTAMRRQIAHHLVENTEMELPERVTTQQAARNLERTRMELAYRGADAMKIEEKLAELRASSREMAMRDLKLFFLLDKAGETLGIRVSDQEVNGRIAQMAMARGERPEKLRQEITSRNQIGTVFNQIREHKTLDAILAKAKVQEVSLADYNAYAEGLEMGAKTPRPGAAAKPPAKKEAKAAEKPEKAEKAEKPATAEKEKKPAPKAEAAKAPPKGKKK